MMSARTAFKVMSRFWLAVWCALSWTSTLHAAEPVARAQLSTTATRMGDPVELHVTVTGGRTPNQPPDFSVDGLRIGYLSSSQNTSVKMINGSFTSESSVTYIYQVEPTRTGQFTIPAVSLAVDGRTIQTQPVGLRVEGGGSSPGGNRSGGGSGIDQRLGQLEVIVSRKTAYVGEILPVEIRLSGDARLRWQPEAMPEIPGEGFTKQKIPEPRRETTDRGGRTLEQYVFRTAITPTKAGKITLGPVEVPFIAQVPRAKQNRRGSSIFDLFNDDSIFGDPFFAVNQRFKAHADAIEIDVKPLPAAGRPVNFSGAVGQFHFEATNSQGEVRIGNPLEMKLTVSGHGNFDRIEPPALVSPAGWRAYPPKSDFKPDDDLGTSGTKTFTMMVIPESKQTATPQFAFSYFDPETAKYVTVKSKPAPLAVTGALPPPPAPVSAPAAARGSMPNETPAQTAQPADILGIRYDAGRGRHSFVPLYLRREFFLAQLVPLAALAGLVLARLRRSDEARKTANRLRRERTDAYARLRRRDLSDQEFLDTAAHVIQLDTAMTTGRAASSVDAVSAISSRDLDAETEEGVERIFSSRAELLYAGMNGGRAQLSAADRAHIMKTVENFERRHAHR